MFDLPTLERILAKFQDLNILVVGDLMLDRYLLGTVNRISPEAPVPVLDYTMTDNRPGGAANVALNLAGLGAKVSICAVVGLDQEGDILMDQMTQAGLSTDQIIRSPDRITTLKTRVMAHKQHLLRVDREVKSDLSSHLEDTLLRTVQQVIHERNPDGIIFQDYNKGCLTSRVIQRSLLLTQEKGIRTYVDPKYYNFNEYRGTTLFKPNLAELQANVPFKVHWIPKGCPKRANIYAISFHATRCSLHSPTRAYFLMMAPTNLIKPVVKRVIEDVCGAGDTCHQFCGLGRFGWNNGR